MTQLLTSKQAKYFEAIEDFIARGINPSFGAIAAALHQKSRTPAVNMVRTLEDKGFLSRDTGRIVILKSVERGPRYVELSPEVCSLVSAYAKGAPLNVAVNELLGEYLRKAAA